VVLALLCGYGLLVNPFSGENGLPCLWKLLLDIECPGCGLSRAGAFLVRGRLVEAISTNWLIVPISALILISQSLNFVQEATKPQTH
jgi:hypothetical protein